MCSSTRWICWSASTFENPDSLVRQLSGGNAQKVLVAREMSSRPRALVVAAPTRGLDVAATETVRRLLGDAADAGVAVVMISEDLRRDPGDEH